ncbi:hypothetical protein GQ55_7G269200 [Panicum hallii var. hallii]|uniref:Uncharacterized protein n=1 Tax=Panicum hallii var. hallii TaxID=1504633 RepID=A0A2T7CZF5_9POAL|nr:hypothetical protein GQ55_7G269200 [Panicum hallii var. hallii]
MLLISRWIERADPCRNRSGQYINQCGTKGLNPWGCRPAAGTGAARPRRNRAPGGQGSGGRGP